ncbi:probable Histidine--tRNA ligase, mitochondrial [Hanseniaspora guilliermondii]|uniref:Histidine--tRNA ligase, mitochondrial n=1 Tax=Hanseniaspora guilliermondii TaxID=56406 RepID=A0A1L0B3K7_9ASCO|nr:probable Histidine--tRNA ligase, mitochondrial [Hanseniaspora guilliermondii]
MSESKLQLTLKTAKGTKDWADKDMVIRQHIFETLTNIFKKHGAITIDTPVFELKEILQGKYGEDSKLIYDLKDQGGELCSLRYDLTVPFARFVAMNNLDKIKRYHIAKVYRRDQPAMTKGRMREFYQCDFDVAGTYDAMIPDSEVMSILVDGLTSLGIDDFKIKLNHRKILDGIFQIAGVKDEDIRKISSAVDKLDKISWEDVKKEIVVEKGQSEAVADVIGKYVKLKGSLSEVIAILEKDEGIIANQKAMEGLGDIKLLKDYVESMEIDSYISFDLSLARGLDYYTGLIYEAVTAASAPPKDALEKKEQALKEKSSKKNKKASKNVEEDDASAYVGVGSIAAGGRYDNLVAMFSEATGKKSAPQIPCVGVSFGVERIFSIIKARSNLDKISSVSTQVFVMAFGGGPEWNGLTKDRLRILKKLWDNGIEAEHMYKGKVNPRKQFDAAEKSGAQVAVILGKEEYLEQGKLRIKKLGPDYADDDGELVDAKDFVQLVEKKLAEMKEANGGLDEITKLVKGI